MYLLKSIKRMQLIECIQLIDFIKIQNINIIQLKIYSYSHSYRNSYRNVDVFSSNNNITIRSIMKGN